jgi:hypothetical protein
MADAGPGSQHLPFLDGGAGDVPVHRGTESAPMTSLTRRSLLQTGAATGAGALTGLRPWSAAPAAAATLPSYLRRSTYTRLVRRDFAVTGDAGPVVLNLLSVSDVAGARMRKALAGSEDAFALAFSGPLATPLDSGTYTVRHPDLGTFRMFVSEVGRPAGNRRYEALVDRSVGVAPSKAPAPSPARPPVVAVAIAAPTAARRVKAVRLLKRVTLRRAGHAVRCEIALRPAARATTVRAKLVRWGRTVAIARHDVHAGRAALRFEPGARLPRGRYVLVVTATGARGVERRERRRVTLR